MLYGSAEHLLLVASPSAAPQGRADVTDAWWARRGPERVEVLSEWRFGSRAEFEAVLRMEIPPDVADPWLTAHPDRLGLAYGYVLFVVQV